MTEPDEFQDDAPIDPAEWWAMAGFFLYATGLLMAALGIRAAEPVVTGTALCLLLAGGVAHLASR